MGTLAQLFIARVQGQAQSHRREQSAAIIFDEQVMPSLQESPDWNTSGTRQWNKDDLAWLQTTPPDEIAADLAQTKDPWIQMAAITELAMHGEYDRAKRLVQNLLVIQPTAETPLTGYFGDEIMNTLKAPAGI